MSVLVPEALRTLALKAKRDGGTVAVLPDALLELLAAAHSAPDPIAVALAKNEARAAQPAPSEPVTSGNEATTGRGADVGDRSSPRSVHADASSGSLGAGVQADAALIRGGIDSLTWLVNNAHNHADGRWMTLEGAAREDRTAALAALDRLVAALPGTAGNE